tara:strand:+ start:1878 stop:2714 length:837 start_codon:yes stop_codon:yes gene_type:complete
MNKKIYFKLLPFIIIGVALMFSFILEFTNSKKLYLLTIGLMAFICGLLFILELRVIWSYFSHFMFNLERLVQFDKHIERPRLFFYLTFGFLNIFSFYNILNPGEKYYFEGGRVFLLRLLFVAFWLSTSLLIFTWTKTFTKKFIPEIQKKLLKADKKRFQPKWENKENYRKLYDNLIDANLITSLKNDPVIQDYDFFTNSLFDKKIPEQALFKIEMDNIESRLFFDLILEGSKGFTLKNMIQIFENKNGTINYDSMKSAYSRNSSGAKEKEKIESCFDI